MRRGRARLRSLTAGMVALTLLVAPPLLLVRAVGNPFAPLPTSLAQVQGWVDQRYIPSELVVGVLALVLWLLWAQYVWALLWEVLVVGPRASAGRLGRSAPGVPMLTRSLVASLVSGVLSAGLTVSGGGPTLAPFTTGTPASAPIDGADQHPAEGSAGTVTPALDGQPRFYQVTAQDTLWRLAGQDDAMVKRILELNEDQIRTPVDVRPGMVLRVPAGLALAGDLAPEAHGPARRPGPEVHVVVPGDNLWQMAEAQLTGAGGPAPSNQQIVAELDQLIAGNAAIIEDPDLIYPGEVFVVGDSAQGGVQSQIADTAGAAPADDVTPISSEFPAARPAGPTPVRAEPTVAPDGQVTGPAGGTSEDRAVDDSKKSDTVVPSLVPVGATAFTLMTVAATSMVGLVRLVRRRQSAALGFVPTGGGSGAQPFLDQLAAVADVGLTLWAAQQLYELAQVASVVETVALASDDGGLEVVWTDEPELVIEGWEAAGPLRWRRAYAGPELEARDRPPVALPGLVTVGELRPRDGRGPVVLANLEAYGSLAVAGGPGRVASVIRAMVYELGLGEHLSNAAVTTVGFAVGDSERLERVTRQGDEEALAAAEEMVRRREAEPVIVGADRELEVYVVRAGQRTLNRFLDLAARGAGVVVIVAGDVRSSRIGGRLDLDDQGSARFDGLEGALVPASLTREHELELAGLIESRSPAGATSGSGETTSAAAVAARHLGAAAPPGNGNGAGLEIRVLGPVRCPGYPDLTAHALSLVVYLALQSEASAPTQAVTRALWGDRPISPRQRQQVVEAARAVVGPAHLPVPASDEEPLRLVAADTDLSRLQRMAVASSQADAATELELLSRAVDLIEGPPFSGVALRWVDASPLADYAAELIEAVVLQTLDRARAAGDLDLAGRAVHRGVVALPTNERIYRAWMLLAAGSGNTALVQDIFRSLTSALAADVGPAERRQPSPETGALFASLAAEAVPAPLAVSG